MQQTKRRPTLEELRSLPKELWLLEVAHIAVEAIEANQPEIDLEADRLFEDPEIAPEKVVALREKLMCAIRNQVQGATGCTQIDTAVPSTQPDAA